MPTPQRKKNRRLFYILALVAAVIVALVVLKWGSTPEEIASSNNEALDIAFNKQGELTFIDGVIGDSLAVIDIEVADNDQRRARGLMYRKSLPENAGMLFTHDAEQIQSFWMKNTHIALDMIFVNADKKIVTIHANTKPMQEWSYASTEPALYVVEVNAGFCAKNNIKNGDRIEFEIGK